MGFSAGAAFSFEAFERVFDGVAGSGGATETSAGGAEREVPQPIPPLSSLDDYRWAPTRRSWPARPAPLPSIGPTTHNVRRHLIHKEGRASNIHGGQYLLARVTHTHAREIVADCMYSTVMLGH